MRQLSLFDGERLTLSDAIELSLSSLTEYGRRYRHWAVAYSGGKDSSATVTFVAWAIKTGRVPRPQSLTILYADTRQELPPLRRAAMELLLTLKYDGFDARVVLPKMDERFYVYMLGRGVPPPKNRFRWCTSQLKIKPMYAALEQLRQDASEKLLMLTGVRLGESAARDQRIALSCSKDSGECGQGWYQAEPPDSVVDTLAPLLHWRLCHVFDWCYYETGRHAYEEIAAIVDVYGEEEVRTGCIACNLASRDVSLERLLRHEGWSHLSPLLELRPLWRELTKARNRLRKSKPEYRKTDGLPGKNAQRLGPLTMKARRYALAKVLDIQRRARVDLINAEEEARIRELWRLNTWPNGWDGDEITGDVPLDAIRVLPDGGLVTQALLVR